MGDFVAGDNVVLNKSAELSAKVVAFCKQLQGERREYEMTRQLIRSVTSIGANLSEANYAQSTADFISKLKIAEKEAGETGYWIKLMHNTGYLEDKLYYNFCDETGQIKRLLSAIITTAKSKQQNIP